MTKALKLSRRVQVDLATIYNLKPGRNTTIRTRVKVGTKTEENTFDVMEHTRTGVMLQHIWPNVLRQLLPEEIVNGKIKLADTWYSLAELFNIASPTTRTLQQHITEKLATHPAYETTFTAVKNACGEQKTVFIQNLPKLSKTLLWMTEQQFEPTPYLRLLHCWTEAGKGVTRFKMTTRSRHQEIIPRRLEGHASVTTLDRENQKQIFSNQDYRNKEKILQEKANRWLLQNAQSDGIKRLKKDLETICAYDPSELHPRYICLPIE